VLEERLKVQEEGVHDILGSWMMFCPNETDLLRMLPPNYELKKLLSTWIK